MAGKVKNLSQWITNLGIEGTFNGEEFVTLCPVHEDTSPSFNFNIEKQVGRCLVCDASFDAIGFLAAKLNHSKPAMRKLIGMEWKPKKGASAKVSQKEIIDWNRKLKSSAKWRLGLERKGITDETIEKYLLGYDGERITIPILDIEGNVINVRRYMPNAKRMKMLSLKGMGRATLYPISELQFDEIIITEGEIKALLLCQMGYHAISATCGAETWSKSWNSQFSGKAICVLYDIDSAGKRNAKKVASNVFPYANSVKIIRLPMTEAEHPKGDITDFIVDLGHTKSDLDPLLEEAEIFEVKHIDEETDDEIFKVHLSQSSLARYSDKSVEINVIVMAKDTEPYLLPKKFKVTCSRDCEFCSFCNVFEMDPDQQVVEISSQNPILLEFIGIHKNKIASILKAAAGIPSPCKVCKFKILDKCNVEELRVVPELDVETMETQQVVRNAFCVNHGIVPNASYVIRSKVISHPKNQHATLLSYDAEPAVDSLDKFKLEKQEIKQLEVFIPKKWTAESVSEKMDEMLEDFEANITRIYQRKDLHLLYMLCWHTVLAIPFQSKVIKGWGEVMVVGDSGQGKSETVQMLLNHYGLGQKVDAKGSTVAGLLGGVQDINGRWFVTWGILPMNDKRLVILEEVKGMPPEVIAKLTDMRSSGVAEITKIQHSRTNARTRVIWITNPRADVPVSQFAYGVQALKPLMGSLEDIRRLDAAMIVASGEVDSKYLNMMENKRPTIKHVFTSDICRTLLLWVWSRKPNQIIIPKETERAILFEADRQGSIYSPLIPLVEKADHRLKLLRLATAAACLTFSSDSDLNVKVRPCHVEFVGQYLDKIYSHQSMGYKEFSEGELTVESELYPESEVQEFMLSLPMAMDLCRYLASTSYVNILDFEELCGVGNSDARNHIAKLRRMRAIQKTRFAYVKSAPFTAHLKRIVRNGLAENNTPRDLSKNEEF